MNDQLYKGKVNYVSYIAPDSLIL